jgi:O-antigen/teichoic acid export membrane protein
MSSDARRVVVNSGIQLAGRMAVLAVSVVSLAVLSRQLGPTRFGQLSTVIAFVAVLLPLTDLGIGAVVVRDAAKNATRLPRLVGNALGIALVGAPLLLGAAAGIAWVAYRDQNTVRSGLLFALAGLAFTSVLSAYAPAFQARSRFGWVTLSDLLGRLACTGALLTAVFMGASVVVLSALLVVAPVIAMTVLALRAHHEQRLRPAFQVREWGPLIKDALPIGASLVIFALYFRIDLLMLGFFRGPSDVGDYAVAYRIVEAILAVPAVFTAAAFPILSAASGTARFSNVGSRIADAMVLAGMFVASAGVVLSPGLVSTVAGDAYSGAASALAVLMVATGLSFLTAVWGNVLITGGQTGFLLRFSAVNLSINVILNAVLIPWVGVVGAAVATLVTELLAAVVAYRRCRTRLDVRLNWPTLGRAITAGAATVGAMLLVPADWWVLRIPVGVATYAAALILLRAVPRAEVTLWRDWVLRRA